MTAEATFTPADQAVRDAIASDVGVNMIVEAGAGTGKTTVLVDRIVRIIASGHAAVHELAVITFTEKAAAELSARVRQGLEDALDAGEAPDAERARIEDAIRGLNHASIETIHAFASSLLRERPVEARLDPGFEVLDTLPAQLAFDEAWDEWLTAETGGDDPPEALVNILNLQLDFKLVREAAMKLNEHRDLLPLAPYPSRVVDAAAALDAFAGEMRELSGMRRHCINEDDRGYAYIGVLEERLADLEALRGHPDALRRAVVTLEPVRTGDGAQGNWRTKQHCIDMKAGFKRIAVIFAEARAAMREAAMADMLAWLQGFIAFYDRRRRDGGKADFDDLLVWARDLVRDNAEVRAYFQQKYRCILVDEFQDTDPLQVEIIVSLCAEGALPGNWREARVRPGSLFVVGDPKQSIYRFRRADIAMYDDVKRTIFGGEPVRITQNFRSERGVIDWVNATFGSLFEEMPGVQPPYVPLVHQPHLGQADRVAILKGVAAGPRMPDARNTEAVALASLIRRQVEGGAWRVREGRAAEPSRAARFGDVVVLVPSRTELHLYEEAFARAGVPYRHEGGRTFFLRQEIRELVALLRAIDDPSDGVAAVAALRSSAFGCSDEDLLLHQARRGRFDFMTSPRDLAGPVAESLERLRALAALRHELALPELVRAALDQTRLVEFAMLQPQGDQVAANLLKVIDQARAFADASGGGLRGFVRWLKENMSGATDETDALISEETDDVVRIITVHASKGLEFPIVVFANMLTKRNEHTRVIADRAAGALHMRLGRKEDGFVTPGFEEAELAEQGHAAAEALRLLYVAGTRAKDRLVIPFIEMESKKSTARAEPECLNDWLRKGRGDAGEEIDIATLPAVDAALPVWKREPPRVEEDAVEGIVEGRARWIASHDALLARAGVPLLVRTASALKPEWERPMAPSDEVRRGGATDFGSAVHAVLERARLRDDGELDRIAAAVAGESGLEERADEIAQIARRALESEAVRRAVRAPRVLLEAPFTLALPGAAGDGGGVAEGRIDLLFEEDGAAVIVDFKTDAVSADDVEARAEQYRNQALVYAWAVQEAAGMPVREVIFLFARPGTEHSYSVGPEFLEEARRRVAAGEPDRALA